MSRLGKGWGFAITPKSRRLVLDIKNLGSYSRQAIRRGFYLSGKELEKTAKKNIMKKPRSGNVYRIRNAAGRYRKHTASVEGESFANFSGKARRSISFKVVDALKMLFGSDVLYVRYLELGRLNRPTLKIAIEENNDKMISIFEAEFRKQMDKVKQKAGA